MDQIKSEIITSHIMKVEPDDHDYDLINSTKTVDQVEIKEEREDGELICKFETEECDIQYIKKEMQDTFEIKDENIEVPSILEFDSGETNINNINPVEETSFETFECKNVTGFQSNLKSPENYALSIRAKKVRTDIGCSLKRDTLQKHIEPKKIISYKCAKCDYTAKRKSQVNSHMLRKHTKVTESNTFKCLECDYSATYKPNLNSHILKKHTKTVKCTKCNYSTALESDLKNYTLMEDTKASKLNRFKCEECEYLTKYKIQLKRLTKETYKSNRIKYI